MDFTPMLCEIPNLSELNSKQLFPAELYTCDKEEILTPTKTNHEFDLNIKISINPPTNKNVSELLITKRKNLQEMLKNNSDLPHVLNRIQPFYKIPNIFKLEGAIKMANMDAIFHLIPQTIDILAYQRKDGILTFGSVAEGPGGFTEYLQYRFPLSNVIGMSLTEPKHLSWNFDVIKRENFVDVLGSDLKGNILTSYNDYINYVKSRYTSGLDFICADAYIGTEIGLSKLLLIEAFISLSCIKLNRSIVIRLDDTFTEFTSHLLFLLSICFQKSYIFKPISAEQHTNEKYFIGKNAIYQKESIISILQNLIIQWEGNKHIETIIDNNSSKKYKLFLENLTKFNNIFISNEISELEKINKFLEAKITNIPRYNVRKAPIIWNLP
jgi:cap1 methyltransferase